MLLFVFQRNATVVYKKLSEIPGLKPVMPQGAMYLMVTIIIIIISIINVINGLKIRTYLDKLILFLLYFS